MEPMYNLALHLIAVIMILQSVGSLKCYDCDSITDQDCNNISVDSDKYLIDCTVDKIGIKRRSPVCYLAQGKVNLMIAEGSALVRGCAEKPLTSNGCGSFELPYRFAELNCSTCSEDKCNGDYISTAGPAIVFPTPKPDQWPRGKNGTGGASGLSPLAGMVLVSLACILVPKL